MSTMDSNQQFDYDLSKCSKCKEILAGNKVDPSVDDTCVEPRPIIPGISKKPIMLVGQAPGKTEYDTRKPFQGQAGQEIRGIFREIGIRNFEDSIWSSAAVKCYPGRKLVKNKRGGYRVEDEVPSATMTKNCHTFLARQIALVDPKVIVTLGGFPLKAYLRLRGRQASEGKLDDFVGRFEQWNERIVFFFPHTSGSSRWLNDYGNRRTFDSAKKLLRTKLIDLGVID